MGEDGRLLCENRGAKVGGASSEDALLVIPLHEPSLRLPGISVGVCGADHVGKSGGADFRPLQC